MDIVVFMKTHLENQATIISLLQGGAGAAASTDKPAASAAKGKAAAGKKPTVTKTQATAAVNKVIGINYETLIQRGLEHSTPDEMRAYLKQVISREREITIKNNEHENPRYERHKDSKVFTLKMFLGYSIGVLFLVFIIAFIVLFTYIVIKDGTLGESGIGLSIINTIQEVLRIILTTGPSNY